MYFIRFIICCSITESQSLRGFSGLVAVPETCTQTRVSCLYQYCRVHKNETTEGLATYHVLCQKIGIRLQYHDYRFDFFFFFLIWCRNLNSLEKKILKIHGKDIAAVRVLCSTTYIWTEEHFMVHFNSKRTLFNSKNLPFRSFRCIQNGSKVFTDECNQ